MSKVTNMNTLAKLRRCCSSFLDFVLNCGWMRVNSPKLFLQIHFNVYVTYLFILKHICFSFFLILKIMIFAKTVKFASYGLLLC